ncbi:MAG: hypothetical protein ACRDJ9_27955 [Dehalococcoidia bacterium]
MRGFLAAIAAAERAQNRDQLLLMRAAQADAKGFERVLKSLG